MDLALDEDIEPSAIGKADRFPLELVKPPPGGDDDEDEDGDEIEDPDEWSAEQRFEVGE